MKEFFVKFFKNWLESIVEALVIIIALYILLWPVKINGISMEDTVNDGDWVLVCRLASWVSSPRNGDIVLFSMDGVDSQMIKRVVGVAGDTVEIKGGNVYINSRRYIESYVDGATEGEFSTVIRDEYFFALGDNRDKSTDSRVFGQVPVGNVKSLVLFRFYPFDELRAYFLERGSFVQTEYVPDVVFDDQ